MERGLYGIGTCETRGESGLTEVDLKTEREEAG
jgi:hypothetical protein